MRSADESWEALLDPRFTVLKMNCRRGRYHIQYLDVVTGWRGTSAQFRLRAAAAAIGQVISTQAMRRDRQSAIGDRRGGSRPGLVIRQHEAIQ